jgi:3-deoxy-D-manno-octulosonic-acid transferase
MALAFAVWRMAARALTPIVRLVLQKRLDRGKESALRIGERLGRPVLARPEGPLLWLHAASVGESISVLPLLERIRQQRPNLNLLVTTGTVTSAELMAERLPPGAFHQFSPVDLPDAVDSFLDHWRPDFVIWIESELWPTTLRTLRSRSVPTVLVNGRMSPRSYRRWRLAPWLIRPMLRCFDAVLAQSPVDGERFRVLGAGRVTAPGNLKLSAPPLAVIADVHDRMRATLAGRPVWLAASTHPGEEQIATAVHQALSPRHPDLLTLIVPRHPGRGPELAQQLANSGLSVALRSAADDLLPETEIYIADTLGELGLWYRLADVVLMGGSFARRGGQNPLEPARLDCAIILGPDTSNFSGIAAGLLKAGGCTVVHTADELGMAVERLLFTDRNGAAALARNAKAWVAGEDQVLDRVCAELEPALARIIPRTG